VLHLQQKPERELSAWADSRGLGSKPLRFFAKPLGVFGEARDDCIEGSDLFTQVGSALGMGQIIHRQI